MDMSWIRKPRHTHEYYAGVQQFLDFAISNAIDGVNIICPCPKCNFKKWRPRNEVNQHLLGKAFLSSYDVWNLHGELITDFGASTSIIEPELIIRDQEATPPLLVEEQPVLETDLFQIMVNDALEIWETHDNPNVHLDDDEFPEGGDVPMPDIPNMQPDDEFF
ncbi:hypothetical protein LINPERPRIM_LOCUS237, partial [Linum perenne]